MKWLLLLFILLTGFIAHADDALVLPINAGEVSSITGVVANAPAVASIIASQQYLRSKASLDVLNAQTMMSASCQFEKKNIQTSNSFDMSLLQMRLDQAELDKKNLNILLDKTSGIDTRTAVIIAGSGLIVGVVATIIVFVITK